MSRIFKICIDPGHGGKDPGAVGPTGLREKDVTLAVSLKVAEILKAAGLAVKLTRTDDTFVGLSQRAVISNQFGADAFVSVHCNSAANDEADGMEVWTSRGQTAGDKLADYLAKELRVAFPNLRLRSDLTDGDLDKEADFQVLKYTRAPATLVELAFISNPAEEKLLGNPDFQAKAARVIAEGLADFLGVQLSKEDEDVTPTKVIYKGKELDGFIKDGTTYVEVRKLCEVFGKKVIWNEQKKIVEVKD